MITFSKALGLLLLLPCIIRAMEPPPIDAAVRTEMNRLIPINLAKHDAQDIKQYLEKHSLDELKNLLEKTYREACVLIKMDRWVLEMPS